MHTIVLLSGPGAVGKNSICEQLLAIPELHLRRMTKWTTRPPREGEHAGREFQFVTITEFEQKIREGKFLEYTRFNDHFYGVPRDALATVLANHNVIMTVERQGMEAIRTAYPQETRAIFVTAPLDQLHARYLARGQSHTEADERIAIAVRDELPHQEAYDLVVENRDGELETAVAEIRRFLQKRLAPEQP
ncbi:hypothetical protein HY523_01885 [Candidatus Berkelbacteria bacterium]|nr:hypothetical protein [Candidatus Berkelbacteria bacterium]